MRTETPDTFPLVDDSAGYADRGRHLRAMLRAPYAARATVHVTRIGPAGDVYGHATRHCNESGCSGTERYLGAIEGAERGHVYELDGRRIVAEIVD